MSEYIEREAALKCICSDCFEGNMEENGFCGIPCDDYKRISKIPAADVRPVVRGKWISVNDGETIVRMKYGEPQDSCKCSACGEWLVASDEYAVKGNFCPNCGTDMRGTNDEKA